MQGVPTARLSKDARVRAGTRRKDDRIFLFDPVAIRAAGTS